MLHTDTRLDLRPAWPMGDVTDFANSIQNGVKPPIPPKTIQNIHYNTTEIKIPKSWHSERGQPDKLEIEDKESNARK